MLAGLRFPNGTVSYIGARPGGGKSTMSINIAREALAAGRNVFFVNLEMVDRAVDTNFILSSMYSGATEVQRGELDGITDPYTKYYSLFKNESDTRETFDRLRETAMEQMSLMFENKLFIYEGAGEALETITNEIEKRLAAGDVVLIDYVQRLSPPRNTNDQQYIKIKLISNALLTLALNKKLVIISGAQFGRQRKEDRGREATMDDFREGGDIEQDAHNAIAIEKITDNEGNDTGRYIHVLKAREGGAKYKRQKLDCNFRYVFIGGIEGEYNHRDQTISTPDKNNTQLEHKRDIWNPGGGK
jgi:replicative DNA helicase